MQYLAKAQSAALFNLLHGRRRRPNAVALRTTSLKTGHIVGRGDAPAHNAEPAENASSPIPRPRRRPRHRPLLHCIPSTIMTTTTTAMLVLNPEPTKSPPPPHFQQHRNDDSTAGLAKRVLGGVDDFDR